MFKNGRNHENIQLREAKCNHFWMTWSLRFGVELQGSLVLLKLLLFIIISLNTKSTLDRLDGSRGPFCI